MKMINKHRKTMHPPYHKPHFTSIALYDGKLVDGKNHIDNIFMIFTLNDGKFVHKLLLQFRDREDITINMQDVCCIY